MADPIDFFSWAADIVGQSGLKPAAHHSLLITELAKIADGQTDRLMIQMPPGSAKSTYASVLFPFWWFHRHPESQIIASCHTASLAEHFGRQVRKTITEHGAPLGLKLAPDSRASGRFALTSGAEYFAAGVRGPITGRRANLILIDDPIKSWAEADSAQARDSLWDWYRAELSARLKPQGRIVLIMTRWHEDDLAGRLMASDDNWRCLRLSALAEDQDPLGRDCGAALWPEWENEEALLRRRRMVGERAFAALYQQAPGFAGERLFDVGRMQLLDREPTIMRAVRAWDLAATLATPGRDPDWTVGLKLGLTQSGLLVILDVIRLRGGPADVEAAIIDAARCDGNQTMVALPQDPGQAGRAQALYLTRQLIGYQVIATPETGAKATRAMPAAAQLQAGNMAAIRSGWTTGLMNEMREFPDGRKDDQIDALSRAVNHMMSAGPASRRLNVPLMSR